MVTFKASNSAVPKLSKSISGMSAVLYLSMTWLRSKTAWVNFSGAGPPLLTLYFMPKSSSGPPGLWLAESISPPSA